MEQENILREVSRLLNDTSDNLDFVISRSTKHVALLKSIRATLGSIEKVLKNESDLSDKQRADFEKAYNLEKACKNQAYFFILESGNLDAFKEYCAQNPRQKFE